MGDTDMPERDEPAPTIAGARSMSPEQLRALQALIEPNAAQKAALAISSDTLKTVQEAARLTSKIDIGAATSKVAADLALLRSEPIEPFVMTAWASPEQRTAEGVQDVARLLEQQALLQDRALALGQASNEQLRILGVILERQEAASDKEARATGRLSKIAIGLTVFLGIAQVVASIAPLVIR